ncbi:serine/threonine-protein kinase BLUS1-like isoform X3 [Vigna unguiculata]|uniref:serine/threonine-protein kinase BLUS1-like isoform X3 n=1 Tax=Vigna unguiculata TaxID=3917 RepID=UPI001015CEE0|nr:serine/threonine-protein kinase BLUS1-like isoform X3 [Vigna unguiculata]
MGGSHDQSQNFSTNPSDYKLLEEVGYGATATVYRAIYLPFNQVVAVKCMDLDRCDINLDDLRREAQMMSLVDHPNVLKAYCSFAVERSLWVVMQFMDEGSCLHLMKIAYTEGFEEEAIGSILKETLKALQYLHHHGHIHRDVKAGNILLGSSGAVKLADFGVAACLFDAGDRQRYRNTFVGTPCWMAPEVLQPSSGYNSKADIWSFGITALELAHGHAPFSKYPPMKVLLMTIQNAPPGLDYDRDKKFSKSFKEMVAMCLVKDQTKRPSAEKLLKHSFFKHVKPPELSVKKLFADLPPLWNRVKALQLKDAAQLAMKKMPSAEEEAISQSQYQRGVSTWNFHIDDLKAQASLVRDDDDIVEMREEDQNKNNFFTNYKAGAIDSEKSPLNKITSQVGAIDIKQTQQNECFYKNKKIPESKIQEPALPKNIICKRNGSTSEAMTSNIQKDIIMSKIRGQTVKTRQTQSGPLLPVTVLNHFKSEREQTSERLENGNQLPGEKNNREVRRPPNFSGPLMLSARASANSLSAPIKSSGGFRDSLDDKSRANLVQIKGRFSVTSENLDLVKDIPGSSVSLRSSQGSSLRKSASVSDGMLDSEQMPISQASQDSATNNISASLLMTHLQNLLQQTLMQQDLIVNLLSSLQSAEGIEGRHSSCREGTLSAAQNNGASDSYGHFD